LGLLPQYFTKFILFKFLINKQLIRKG